MAADKKVRLEDKMPASHRPRGYVAVEIRTYKAGQGTWKVEWFVTASEEFPVALTALGLKRSPKGYSDPQNSRFEARGLPLSLEDWSASPLASFLGRLCDKARITKNKGRFRGVVILIDDCPSPGEDPTTRPLVRWNRATVQVADGSNVSLGDEFALVCTAVGSGYTTSDPEAQRRCYVLLPATTGGGQITEASVKHACSLEECTRCLPLLDEHKKVLKDADRAVTGTKVRKDVLSGWRYLTESRLTIEHCNDWEEIRRTIIDMDPDSLAWVGKLQRAGLCMESDTSVSEGWPADFGTRKMRLWMCLPLGSPDPCTDAKWLGWPYGKSHGPDTFVSADAGLSNGECCMVLGVITRLYWLLGWDLSSIARWLHIRVRDTCPTLMSKLQFAAREPFEPLIGPAAGRPPAAGLRHVAEFCASASGRSRHRSGVDQAFSDVGIRDHEETEAARTADAWATRLNRIVEEGKLRWFTESLLKECGEGEALEAVRKMEQEWFRVNPVT